MIVAATVAGVCLLVTAGLAWTARLLHVGNLDALGLAEKVATPEPRSALDWPELQVRAVVPQDIAGEPSLVLLLVEWPAHRECAATLLVDFSGANQRSLPLLAQWCAARASVSPTRRGHGELELRRRQSLDRVCGVLVAEDSPGGAP